MPPLPLLCLAPRKFERCLFPVAYFVLFPLKLKEKSKNFSPNWNFETRELDFWAFLFTVPQSNPAKIVTKSALLPVYLKTEVHNRGYTGILM